MVADHTSGLGHVVELGLLPEFDRREVSHVVIDRAEGPFDRGAFKRVRDHPTVLRIQVAFIDELAVAGQERVLLVPELAVHLPEHEYRIL